MTSQSDLNKQRASRDEEVSLISEKLFAKLNNLSV